MILALLARGLRLRLALVRIGRRKFARIVRDALFQIIDARLELGIDTLEHVAGHILHFDVRLDAATLDDPFSGEVVGPELRRGSPSAVHQRLVPFIIPNPRPTCACRSTERASTF
ncbi:MAG: hypothetical protein J5J06_17610 [Phycisphaerae bacterium]|nr:hypothetical protein [Phycisphaerae bacterium]